MQISDYKIFLEVAGGLSVLLYGIHLLGANLQRVLGSKLEEIIRSSGKRPVTGVIAGAGVTAIIQSSGTVAMMLIGFISAGLMNLKDAVPVMLGSSIGGTITVQLASFKVGIFAMPILFIGFIFFSYFTNRTYRSLGKAAIGLGLLFLGMDFMLDGTQLLFSSPYSLVIYDNLNANGPFAIFVSALFTFLIQSASASSVLVLSLVSANIVDVKAGLFLILGVNLGASLKIVYLALRGKNFSPALSFVHLIFNFFGLVIFVAFFGYYQFLVMSTSNDAGMQVANAHTLYNIVNTVLFMPFIPLVTGILEKYIIKKEEGKARISILDKRLIYTPSIALEQVNKAVVNMATITYEMLENAKLMMFEGRVELLKKARDEENEIDEMTGNISEYAMRISEQNLTKKDSLKLYSLMHILTDIEHMSDHILVLSETISKLKQEKIVFSEKAMHELTAVFGKLKMMQNLIIKSLEENNLELANEIMKHENKVDEIVKKSLSNHINRVKNGTCTLESGNYFAELLGNLERIGDHSDNVAYAVIDRFRYK